MDKLKILIIRFRIPIIISLCIIFFLPIIILRDIFKEKYAEAIYKLPQAGRERLIKTDKRLLPIFRTLIWLTPFYLIFVPLAVFFYLREDFQVVTICMVLFVILILQEYLFRKWFVTYLESRDLQVSHPYSNSM